jgi:alpha-glucosidase
VTARPWWEGAIIYQIYPRSFCLADPAGRRQRLGLSPKSAPDRLRDGAGDLAGILSRLDHVVSLGAKAVWLSPIFCSPMADFGYDVADYCDIDPLFGDLATFDLLLEAAHQKGLRVLLDWVPNHTSSEHPWFKQARSDRQSPMRDFYIWRDPDEKEPGRPPNNWRRAFGEGPAWTFDEATGQWYLHLFLPEQPDLNWENPAVIEAMEQVLDFWLGRGVDGFRIDVVHGLVKPAGLPDVATDKADIPYSSQNDEEGTHSLLRRFREKADSYPQSPVLVGEVFLIDTAKMARYYGSGDELHLAFNFTPMFTRFSKGGFERRLQEMKTELEAIGAVPTWVLSSHDRPRHATRYGGSEARARAAAVLSLTMWGTVFLYAGEELGLEDAEVPEEMAVDPGGRDGCRAPLPWDATPEHGWALEGGGAWLPFPPHATDHNAASEAEDPSSLLWLYRRLASLRQQSQALSYGRLELVSTKSPEVLAYARRLEAEEVLVAINFSAEPAEPGLDGSFGVLETSGGEGSLSRAGSAFSGRLGPEEAVVLRRFSRD